MNAKLYIKLYKDQAQSKSLSALSNIKRHVSILASAEIYLNYRDIL